MYCVIPIGLYTSNEDHILDCCLFSTNIYSAPMARTGSKLLSSILKLSVPPNKVLDLNEDNIFDWCLLFTNVSFAPTTRRYSQLQSSV